jgi:hypothetical protein
VKKARTVQEEYLLETWATMRYELIALIAFLLQKRFA